MRKFIFSLAMGATLGLSAQEHWCGATEAMNQWFAQHPAQLTRFNQLQQQAAEQDAQMAKSGYKQPQAGNAQQRTANTTSTSSNYTVPIVFHILHTGGSENISDAQVQDAVAILTRDFNKRNADTSTVVSQFANIIGNPKFEFQLATKDPNGNCTNGIIRHWDVNTDWTDGFNGNGFNDYIYTWPPTKYLNVYVVKSMGGGAAGYTYLPGTGVPTSADAVVILSTYVGSIGTGSDFTSRALTHEVGHWFNLAHLWGNTNQPGVACGDDGVTDTPVTKGYTSCTLSNPTHCTTGVVENMQNYMDYAYCQRMFTLGQTTRMINAMNSSVNSRNNISTAGNLAITGVTSPGTGCIPQLQLGSTTSFTVCAGKPLNIVTFTFNANPTTYAWNTTGGGLLTSAAGATTAVTYSAQGTQTISCTVSNGNGSSTQSAIVLVKDAVPQVTVSYGESFEAGIVPTNWNQLSLTSPTEQWDFTSDGASDGVTSAYIAGENFNANAIAILESPSYDFQHHPNAIFTFKYAYRRPFNAASTPTVPNHDIFKVQVSKNCGGSWTDVFAPTSASLAAGSGGQSADLYYPAANEWKLVDVTQLNLFNQFKTEPNVTFRFYFQEDQNGVGHANRFYLDEINFSAPVGINAMTKAINFNVYPNPTSNAFNLSFELPDAAKIKYQVVSVTGAVLLSEPEKQMAAGTYEIKLNNTGKLSTGIYFLNLDYNGFKMSKKVIIE